MEVVGQRHALAFLTRETDPISIGQEADWVPGLVWTGAENFTVTRIRLPKR
jgi:hypothetical protein